MALQDIVQSLDLETPIDLFTLSPASILFNLPTVNFCNIGNVSFGGVQYLAVPIDTDWQSKTSEGTESQSTLVVSDVNADVANLLENYTGILGANLTVKRTWSVFLDSAVSADPTQYLEFRMRINQYSGSYQDRFEFTCIPAASLERKQIPARSYLRRCQWKLSGEECKAPTNIHFDLSGNSTTPQNRACSKDLDGCRRYQGHTINFGGYPGTQRRR